LNPDGSWGRIAARLREEAMRTRAILVALAGALLATRAGAIDVANGKLTVSGFGEWGYGRTTNENAYLVGEEDGGYENAQFALGLTAQPQDDVVVAGQLFLAADGEASLDWAFAEYRLNDLLRIRAGKVKNPLGLFMEVKDVGTLRPFFTLPQSIYGPASFAAEAYLGVGVTGAWETARGWGLGYDVYGGALEVPSLEPGDVVLAGPPPASGYDFSMLEVEEQRVRDVVGGRVSLQTPFEGLTARISAFTGELVEEVGTARVVCFGVSGEYAIDRFQIRGEFFRATEGDAETHLGGYAEVAWSFLPNLQVAFRFDESHQHQDGLPASSPFLRHHENVFGLSYWPSPNLVLKLSYHDVDGNRFAVPALSAPDGSTDGRTGLFVGGAQFSF
jgi:hypothetical protein